MSVQSIFPATKPLLTILCCSFTQVMQLDPNIVVQLFSPLVTSQRIMATQFNNPYTSISCQDGTNVVFKEVHFYYKCILLAVVVLYSSLSNLKQYQGSLCISEITP